MAKMKRERQSVMKEESKAFQLLRDTKFFLVLNLKINFSHGV